jgi:hypothetical protein
VSVSHVSIGNSKGCAGAKLCSIARVRILGSCNSTSGSWPLLTLIGPFSETAATLRFSNLASSQNAEWCTVGYG